MYVWREAGEVKDEREGKIQEERRKQPVDGAAFHAV